MKIFISSVVAGFEAHRDAVESAAKTLRHEVIRSEELGAVTESSQVACLSGVRDSDFVILLLGARYGYVQESGISATHEEFREARDSKPVLAFVQQGVEPEERQCEFIAEVRKWESGIGTSDFSDPASLRDAVSRALHDYALSLASGGTDTSEMATRAAALVPQERPIGAFLVVVVVGGPAQSILRPSEIEDETLSDYLAQRALFGLSRVLAQAEGVRREVRDHALVLAQPTREILVDEMGSIRIIQPALHVELNPGPAGLLSVLIEEEVRDRIGTCLQFATECLERVDPTKRLTELIPVVSLLGARAAAWRTLEEHRLSPSSMTLGSADDVETVQLSPAARKRQVIAMQADTLADDFTVLLRRRIRST